MRKAIDATNMGQAATAISQYCNENAKGKAKVGPVREAISQFLGYKNHRAAVAAIPANPAPMDFTGITSPKPNNVCFVFLEDEGYETRLVELETRSLIEFHHALPFNGERFLTAQELAAFPSIPEVVMDRSRKSRHFFQRDLNDSLLEMTPEDMVALLSAIYDEVLSVQYLYLPPRVHGVYLDDSGAFLMRDYDEESIPSLCFGVEREGDMLTGYGPLLRDQDGDLYIACNSFAKAEELILELEDTKEWVDEDGNKCRPTYMHFMHPITLEEVAAAQQGGAIKPLENTTLMTTVKLRVDFVISAHDYFHGIKGSTAPFYDIEILKNEIQDHGKSSTIPGFAYIDVQVDASLSNDEAMTQAMTMVKDMHPRPMLNQWDLGSTLNQISIEGYNVSKVYPSDDISNQTIMLSITPKEGGSYAYTCNDWGEVNQHISDLMKQIANEHHLDKMFILGLYPDFPTPTNKVLLAMCGVDDMVDWIIANYSFENVKTVIEQRMPGAFKIDVQVQNYSLPNRENIALMISSVEYGNEVSEYASLEERDVAFAEIIKNIEDSGDGVAREIEYGTMDEAGEFTVKDTVGMWSGQEWTVIFRPLLHTH